MVRRVFRVKTMKTQKTILTVEIIFAVIINTVLTCAAIFAFLCISLFWLLSASKDYRSVNVKNICYEYNPTFKKAVAAVYDWDGSLNGMEITVADRIEETNVTVLGNSVSGPSHAFLINLPEEMDTESSFLTSSVDEYGDGDYETLVFTINLGENITEIAKNKISPEKCGYQYIVDETKNEDGVYEYDVLYRIVFCFNVAKGNQVFYSDGGKLYYKGTDELVDIYDYGD